MKTVYLAGPIRGLDYDEATSWRDDAREVLAKRGVRALSPLRGKEYLRSVGKLVGSQSQAGDYPEFPMSTAKGITTRDRNDVLTSDLVLAYLKGAESVSTGTAVEFGWADAFRKPVVMVEEAGGTHDHAMLNEIAGFRVGALEEAIDLVFAILGV